MTPSLLAVLLRAHPFPLIGGVWGEPGDFVFSTTLVEHLPSACLVVARMRSDKAPRPSVRPARAVWWEDLCWVKGVAMDLCCFRENFAEAIARAHPDLDNPMLEVELRFFTRQQTEEVMEAQRKIHAFSQLGVFWESWQSKFGQALDAIEGAHQLAEVLPGASSDGRLPPGRL